MKEHLLQFGVIVMVFEYLVALQEGQARVTSGSHVKTVVKRGTQKGQTTHAQESSHLPNPSGYFHWDTQGGSSISSSEGHCFFFFPQAANLLSASQLRINFAQRLWCMAWWGRVCGWLSRHLATQLTRQLIAATHSDMRLAASCLDITVHSI